MATHPRAFKLGSLKMQGCGRPMGFNTQTVCADTRAAVLRSAQFRLEAELGRLASQAVIADSRAARAARAAQQRQLPDRRATCWFVTKRPFTPDITRSVCFCPRIRALVPRC